jgi:hypothetical protein
MSTNLPTSWRFPFQLTGKVHPDAENAIRDAIRALNDKVNAQGATVVTKSATATPAISASGTTTPTIGKVNDQTGATAVTLQQTDYGALVILDAASSIAVTLNNAVTTPYFSVLENQGTSTATLTPTSGTVNTLPSIPLPPNAVAIVYFDGLAWWATPIFPQPSNIIPAMDSGSGAVGSSLAYSREDHIHPDSGATVVAPTLTSATLGGVTTIQNLQIFANNAAALAGGLVAGQLYRSGADPDVVFIVH